jgi:hypothetical protein
MIFTYTWQRQCKYEYVTDISALLQWDMIWINRLFLICCDCTFSFTIDTNNRIGDVMVRVFASSAVCRGLEPWAGQTKDYILASSSYSLSILAISPHRWYNDYRVRLEHSHHYITDAVVSVNGKRESTITTYEKQWENSNIFIRKEIVLLFLLFYNSCTVHLTLN